MATEVHVLFTRVESVARVMTAHPARAQGGINPQSIGGHVEPTKYRITVRGRLSRHLASAFEGFDLEPGNEHSVLAGEIRDQAHLYGILDRVRDLGLELVSVERVPGDCRGDEETAR
jgi:hypothetical protein